MQLLRHEKVLTDSGYTHEKCVAKCSIQAMDHEFHQRVRALHESINGRIKRFRVVDSVFRHGLYLHKRCFFAVVNVVQLMMEIEEPAFTL